MSKIFIFLLGAAAIGALFFSPSKVQAQGSCFCSTVPKESFSDPAITDPKLYGDNNKYDAACFDVNEAGCAEGGANAVIDDKYKSCGWYVTSSACQTVFDGWKKAKDDAIQNFLKSTRSQRTELHNKGVIERLLPSCVFESQVQGDCKHINIFIKVGIDIADYILGIVGALALVVFIYGGILMIISEGNSDRVEKGKGAMVAAFIGLIVVFGAYILVKFFAGVVGVQPGFNLQ